MDAGLAPENPAEATAWLDVEHGNPMACIAHAADQGRFAHVADLATPVRRHRYITGRIPAALAVAENALRAARAAGDRRLEARAMPHIGSSYNRQGRFPVAAEHLRRTLATHRETGNRTGKGIALLNTSGVHHRQGDFAAGYRESLAALAIVRETGDRAAVVSAALRRGGDPVRSLTDSQPIGKLLGYASARAG